VDCSLRTSCNRNLRCLGISTDPSSQPKTITCSVRAFGVLAVNHFLQCSFSFCALRFSGQSNLPSHVTYCPCVVVYTGLIHEHRGPQGAAPNSEIQGSSKSDRRVPKGNVHFWRFRPVSVILCGNIVRLTFLTFGKIERLLNKRNRWWLAFDQATPLS